jgi:hypothetical protein
LVKCRQQSRNDHCQQKRVPQLNTPANRLWKKFHLD